MMRKVVVGGLVVVGLFLLAGISVFLLVLYQGKRLPVGDPHYVAMGSSFAAGIGLGPRVPESPIACMRTVNGYPQQLARVLNVPSLDVTCSGATTDQVLHGGQYFQRAQIDALTSRTKLVTITSGGNDIQYVGDLSLLAARNDRSVLGWIVRHFWGGPLRPGQRDYTRIRRDLATFVEEARRRAPLARIVIVTYPMILPPSENCPRLNIEEEQVHEMGEVGEHLAAATRAAAHDSGATLVDMQRLGAGHHACSATPWVNGWIDAQGTPFHPTLLGARAIAEAVAAAIRQ